jgi:hypothetical protein
MTERSNPFPRFRNKAGVAGIYNRAKYLPEMREALVKWANHVEAITSSAPKAHALVL